MNLSPKSSLLLFYLLCSLIVLISLNGCNIKNENVDDKLIQLIDTSTENDWGGDVLLKIINIKNISNNKIYIIKALYNKDTVGLEVIIPNKKIKGNGFSNGLQISSIGKISDNFLHALAAIYKLNMDSSSVFINKVSVSYVDLNQFAISTGNRPTENNGFDTYKLFFENLKETDDGEAEIFLNINENSKIVQLREKDEEYRKPLINALKQK